MPSVSLKQGIKMIWKEYIFSVACILTIHLVFFFFFFLVVHKEFSTVLGGKKTYLELQRQVALCFKK